MIAAILLPSFHFCAWQVQAVNGIAVFDNLIPLVPSVYITNATTGEPYVSGQAVHPRVCCALVYRVFTAEPGLATTIISNPFHNFRMVCMRIPLFCSVWALPRSFVDDLT